MGENGYFPLEAEAFFHDSRVVNAKKEILAALHDHQEKLIGIRPPRPDIKNTYQEMLNTYAELRGGKLYYPYLGSGLGRGLLVELADGSVKYDLISGIGVHHFGHSHPALMLSSLDAALTDTLMQGHLQQNTDSYALTTLLTKISGLPHVFLASSGAMANENALKIAFQKKFPAQRILAFERCFMGRTLALAQITDKATFREGLPETLSIDYLPYYDPKDPEQSTQRTLQALQKLLERYPKQYAVMCFELVQGEGGFYHGSKAFFEAVMRVLKEHQIAIFVDEVQTFGRTSQPFAYQHFGLEPYVDLATIGKLSQVCATFFTEAFKPKPGLISQTFTSSTAAIKGAKTLLELLIGGNFFGEQGMNIQIQRFMHQKLEELEKKYPHALQGPFGIGTMVAFTPLGGHAAMVSSFVQELFAEGLIAFTAGKHPTRVRFLIPAGAATFEDLERVMAILEKTLIKFLNT